MGSDSDLMRSLVIVLLVVVALAAAQPPDLPSDFDADVSIWMPFLGTSDGHLYMDTSNQRWRVDLTDSYNNGGVELLRWDVDPPTHWHMGSSDSDCTVSNITYSWQPVTIPPYAYDMGPTTVDGQVVELWEAGYRGMTLRYYVAPSSAGQGDEWALVRFAVYVSIAPILEIDLSNTRIGLQPPSLFDPTQIGCASTPPVPPPFGQFSVMGFVTSAMNFSTISDATVSLYDQGDQHEWDTTTNDAGMYEIDNVPAGAYTLRVTAHGYQPFERSIYVNRSIPVGTVGDVPLSPALAFNEMRIVLTWEATPPDLDARLKTPFGCEVSYYNKVCSQSSSNAYSELDLDRSQGYGPETITTLDWASGSYYYNVHVFAWSSGFAGQGEAARVQVWNKDGLVGSYSPPDASGCVGCTWWRVLRINGSTRTITPINQLAQSEGDFVDA